MTTIDEVRQEKYLYLTTTGRKTGRPHEIEIWFVENQGNLYILSERKRQADWVRNIEKDSTVRVRLANLRFSATARVLDKELDAPVWQSAQRLSGEKYEWGDGLPVEIVPSQSLVS